MTVEIDVVIGTEADVPAAQQLIEGARQWLRARSIDQWQDPIPDSTIVNDVQRGHFFVMRDHGEVIAIITVADDDSDTWGASTGDAFYVHRLAIAQSYRGENLGSSLLQWAGERAAAAGKASVRLDCAADNSGLRHFYERQGFVLRRDVAVMAPTGTRSLAVSLYEKLVQPEKAALLRQEDASPGASP